MTEPLPIFRATAAAEAGAHASTLRRRTQPEHRRQMIRLAPNAFVTRSSWEAAGPRRRHITRMHARVGRLGTHATASHVTAAAVHDLPWLREWPTAVHITVPRSHVRRSTPELVVHSRPLTDQEVVLTDTIRVTTLARTAIDIALSAHRRESIVVLDAVLGGGVTQEDLLAELDRHPTARGRPSAESAIEFADGAADAVSESLARVVFDELGTPPPILQQEFLVDGHRYRADFWFPDQGVIIEIDGRAKYEQPRYMNGRSPTEVILDEKRRHERLLTVPEVQHIIRLEWRDLFDRRALFQRLRAAGVPCRRIDEISACSLLAA